MFYYIYYQMQVLFKINITIVIFNCKTEKNRVFRKNNIVVLFYSRTEIMILILFKKKKKKILISFSNIKPSSFYFGRLTLLFFTTASLEMHITFLGWWLVHCIFNMYLFNNWINLTNIIILVFGDEFLAQGLHLQSHQRC